MKIDPRRPMMKIATMLSLMKVPQRIMMKY